ncbi:hypothetical protein ACFOGG_04050 [Brenneria rubrifaciens]|uniref:hypothetical protein n=1 Tax=Brenneria rubrifaciens TaxID=55213 RepID=UPI003617975A
MVQRHAIHISRLKSVFTAVTCVKKPHPFSKHAVSHKDNVSTAFAYAVPPTVRLSSFSVG